MSAVSERAAILSLLTTNKAALGLNTVEHSKGQLKKILEQKSVKPVPAVFIWMDTVNYNDQDEDEADSAYKDFYFDLYIVTRATDNDDRSDSAATIQDKVETLCMKTDYYPVSYETVVSGNNYYIGKFRIRKEVAKVATYL